MNTKSFVKILRKVVREEVRLALKETLNESKVTDEQAINTGLNLHELVDRPAPSKKKFAKNSMLNDILNETAATGDFATMHDGPINMPTEYPSMGPTRTSDMVQQPMTGIKGERVDTSKPEMQAINKALNRDYSSMIKAIDKKNGKMYR